MYYKLMQDKEREAEGKTDSRSLKRTDRKGFLKKHKANGMKSQ
jgi:hypothetical protein